MFHVDLPKADVVLLSNVLHDWDVPECRTLIGRCAEESLVYLSVHNHRGTTHVHLSEPDLAAHARGYPALLDITNGGPVGALVFAQQAIAGEIWTAHLRRHRLHHAQIVGLHPHKLFPEPPPLAP